MAVAVPARCPVARVSAGSTPVDVDATVFSTVCEIIDGASFPCLGARSVFHQHGATVAPLPALCSEQATSKLLAGLLTFAEKSPWADGFASFVAAFDGPAIRDEMQFECLLWRQLQLLHDRDPKPWSSAVSSDPASREFAFSLGETPYFVVGLHPRASRMARRFPFPILVFNPHAQFERLRGVGKYEGMRTAILDRDLALQGYANPMLSDHGVASPAAQYSGRTVDPGWRAPFDAWRA